MRKHCYAGAVAAFGSLILLLPALAQAAPTPAQRCQAAKLLAAGSEARAHLACTKLEDPIACLTKAAERRDKAFSRAEARGGCVTTGDSADIGAEVDALLADLLALLRPGGFTKAKCTNGQLRAAAIAINQLA